MTASMPESTQLAEVERSWLEEGFAVRSPTGPFTPALGTHFVKQAGDHLVFRVLVLPGHCNGKGSAHGGFLAGLADVWLAGNVLHRLPPTARIVTANLSVDYLARAHAGDVLESSLDRIRVGARLCHISGAILRNGEAVAAMRGTFALVSDRAATRKDGGDEV